jgi:hypothetical protein
MYFQLYLSGVGGGGHLWPCSFHDGNGTKRNENECTAIKNTKLSNSGSTLHATFFTMSADCGYGRTTNWKYQEPFNSKMFYHLFLSYLLLGGPPRVKAFTLP